MEGMGVFYPDCGWSYITTCKTEIGKDKREENKISDLRTSSLFLAESLLLGHVYLWG